MEGKHSDSYMALSDKQKDIADAILSYLNNENTRSVEIILMALIQEIKYHSKIES